MRALSQASPQFERPSSFINDALSRCPLRDRLHCGFGRFVQIGSGRKRFPQALIIDTPKVGTYDRARMLIAW